MALRNDINGQTKSDISSYSSAIDGQAYLVLGESAMGDTPIRFYYYDASATTTADGENVLTATGMGVGRFIKTLPQTPPAGTKTFNNSASRSFTTSTGATGFQVSSTKDAFVNYSITIAITSSLSGNVSGTVVLEIASTNSTTAGDWTEIGRIPNGQNDTLIIGVSLAQTGGGQIGGIIPAGYYAKLRTISTGSPTYTYNSGQEVTF